MPDGQQQLETLVRQLQSRFPHGDGPPPSSLDTLGAEWTDDTTGEKYLRVVAGWRQITHA